ncbi:hypothetical protein B0T14DRAFT_494105 [Immersiella caudata]|uniref:Uncharacterized protein n=1 Tax=Immersiella caudata TaxID=314043 RepID=A0AA39WVQ0_9PEZI|nr:hypothetical protein B0T14DRAFT_494105 [Immersiella caudata]
MVHPRDFLHNSFGHEGANRLHAEIMAALEKQARRRESHDPWASHGAVSSNAATFLSAVASLDVAAPTDAAAPDTSTPSSPTNSNSPPETDKEKSEAIDQFQSSISALQKSPAQQVAMGRVPAPTNIAVSPSGFPPAPMAPAPPSKPTWNPSGPNSALDLFHAGQVLAGLSDQYAAYWAAVDKSPMYNITIPEQANLAFAQEASDAFNATIRALPGVLTVSSSGQNTLQTESDGASVHLGIINTLFSGVGLGAEAIADVDSILTSVAQSLSSIKVSTTSQKNTIDQFARSIATTNLNLGTADIPINITQGFLN